MLASVEDAEVFVLQIEKEINARKQAINWEKDFEANGKVCLPCKKRIGETETHEHPVYDRQEVLLETESVKNCFQDMIKEHKQSLMKIEKSSAELHIKKSKKKMAQKKLNMCNTGILAITEIDKQLTGDSISLLASLKTLRKHFGDVEMALQMDCDLLDLFQEACETNQPRTIRNLLKLLDNFPVSGKYFLFYPTS